MAMVRQFLNVLVINGVAPKQQSLQTWWMCRQQHKGRLQKVVTPVPEYTTLENAARPDVAAIAIV
jgi:hypothetical protein